MDNTFAALNSIRDSAIAGGNYAGNMVPYGGSEALQQFGNALYPGASPLGQYAPSTMYEESTRYQTYASALAMQEAYGGAQTNLQQAQTNMDITSSVLSAASWMTLGAFGHPLLGVASSIGLSAAIPMVSEQFNFFGLREAQRAAGEVITIEQMTQGMMAESIHRVAWDVLSPVVNEGLRGTSINMAQDAATYLYDRMQGMGFQGAELSRIMPGLESIGAFDGASGFEDLINRAERYIGLLADFMRNTRATLEEGMQTMGVGFSLGVSGGAIGGFMNETSLAATATGMAPAQYMDIGAQLAQPWRTFGGDMSGFIGGFGDAMLATQLSSRMDLSPYGEVAWRGDTEMTVAANVINLGSSRWLTPAGINRAAAFSMADEAAFDEYARTGTMPSGIMSTYQNAPAEQRYEAIFAAGEWASQNSDRLFDPTYAGFERRWDELNIESTEGRAGWLMRERPQYTSGMTGSEIYAMVESMDFRRANPNYTEMMNIDAQLLAQQNQTYYSAMGTVRDLIGNAGVLTYAMSRDGLPEAVVEQISTQGAGYHLPADVRAEYFASNLQAITTDDILLGKDGRNFEIDIGMLTRTQLNRSQADIAMGILNAPGAMYTAVGAGGRQEFESSGGILQYNERTGYLELSPAGQVFLSAPGTDSIILSGEEANRLTNAFDETMATAITPTGLREYYPQDERFGWAIERTMANESGFRGQIESQLDFKGTSIGRSAIAEYNMLSLMPTGADFAAMGMGFAGNAPVNAYGGSAGAPEWQSLVTRTGINDLLARARGGGYSTPMSLAKDLSETLYSKSWNELTPEQQQNVAAAQRYYFADTDVGSVTADSLNLTEAIQTTVDTRRGALGHNVNAFLDAVNSELTPAARESLMSWAIEGTPTTDENILQLYQIAGRELGSSNIEDIRNALAYTESGAVASASEALYARITGAGVKVESSQQFFSMLFDQGGSGQLLQLLEGVSSSDPLIQNLREAAQGGFTAEELTDILSQSLPGVKGAISEAKVDQTPSRTSDERALSELKAIRGMFGSGNAKVTINSEGFIERLAGLINTYGPDTGEGRSHGK